MYDIRQHWSRAVLPAMAALSMASAPAPAQQSAPASPPQAAGVAPYRPPAISLVQPINGGTVPVDRPVVVLRFAQGETTDAIDARSLSLTVDGRDCTNGFHVSGTEAWGPLCNAEGRLDTPPEVGVHLVVARVCSARGACAEMASTITVVESAARARNAAPASSRTRVLDLLIRAARKLLDP